IGVAYGTPYLYDAFPEAEFHLFDPTREALPHMKKWAEKLNANIYNLALGDNESFLEVRTRDTIQHATLLKDLTEPDIKDVYTIPVRRFDALDLSIEQPALCKIDVEGFEMPVLKGMGGSLQDFEFIVVETSLVSLYEAGASSLDVL